GLVHPALAARGDPGDRRDLCHRGAARDPVGDRPHRRRAAGRPRRREHLRMTRGRPPRRPEPALPSRGPHADRRAAHASTAGPRVYTRVTWTRVSWKTAPPPMSESRSATRTLAFAPPDSLGQRPLTVATTPGRTSSLTAATASKAPRSLWTRTRSPSPMPRAAASAGWRVTRNSPARRRSSGLLPNAVLREWWEAAAMSASG